MNTTKGINDMKYGLCTPQDATEERLINGAIEELDLQIEQFITGATTFDEFESFYYDWREDNAEFGADDNPIIIDAEVTE
jgi:hypothetical protein